MTKGRRLGWILSIVLLCATASLGIYNGVRELSFGLTPLQRSVSIGVLTYGIAGLAAAVALIARHPSSVWLVVFWGATVTYVSSFAAIAYAGADATLVGAIAAGIGTALMAAAVVWIARVSTQRDASPPVRVVVLVGGLLILGAGVLGGCRQLYSGPPAVMGRSTDGLVTKVVRAKRDPDRLIAQDLSVCWVLPEVYAGIRPGDHWRCDWRHIPEGQ
jgi:hypothetical protein